MDETFRLHVRAIAAEGKGESIGGSVFLPFVTLDSGARVGTDADGTFVLASAEGDTITPYSAEDAHVFHEVLEWKRDRFDDKLDEAGRALGLPEFEASLAFPAFGVVRAVLAKNMNYTTLLALAWLRPSELREVQADIRRVAEDKRLPTSTREFAQRLVVPS
ncbi:hypothetical protein [Polyangium fumosum]|uniref:Uncharacterized protein n=1 Tax=Polyangium fumosum TaxID=889272 RepID=A0A4V6WQS4_9BACT|nr:hypothetical protein [Polyangium fumosum]TKD08656.1 hypothetical protein E8A74_15360 [Polyangium fumosum]